MAGKVALEPEVASAKLFVALESTNEVAAIGGQLGLSGAGRGKVAEEELEREHDPAARRLVLHLVKPAAQRPAALARDPIDGLVRPAALLNLARPRQTARGQARQRLVDLALGRRPNVGDTARREPREIVARSFAEGREAKHGALRGG